MLSQVTLPGDKNQTELMLPGSSPNNGGGAGGAGLEQRTQVRSLTPF